MARPPRLLLLLLAGVAAAANLCETTCLSMAGAYSYSDCTADTPSTTEPCCTSAAYSGTYSLCLARCAAKQRLATWKTFQSTCGLALCSSNSSYDDVYAYALDHYVEVADVDLTTEVYEAVEFGESSFNANFAYYKAKAGNALSNKIYGAAIAGYWLVIIGLAILMRLYRAIFDRSIHPRGAISRAIQTYVALPAFFGHSHAEPVRIFGFPVGLQPLRWQAFVVLGYVVANLLLVVAEFDVSYAAADVQSVFIQTLSFYSKRTGVMAVAMMVPMFVFSGRNTYLMLLTGWSNDTFKLFHRWIARVLVVDAIVHSIMETMYLVQLHSYKAYVTESVFRIIGITTTGVACIIAVQSAYYFRRRFFEGFLSTHILLALFFLVALGFHVMSTVYLRLIYACAGIYACDRLLRIGRVLYGNLSGHADMRANRDATQIRVRPAIAFRYRAGQYAYVYTLRLNFWQANPFSIAECRERGREYVFVAKKFDRVTARLHDAARTTTNSGNVMASATGTRVWIEGPYGATYPLERYASVLLVAGGVGITAVMSYAMQLKRAERICMVHVHWVVREKENVRWVDAQLAQLAMAENFDIHIHVTAARKDDGEREPITIKFGEKDPGITTYEFAEYNGNDDDDGADLNDEYADMTASLVTRFTAAKNVTFHYGRPVLRRLVRYTSELEGGSMAVFACGPGSMTDGVREAIVQELWRSPERRIDYFEDSFS
ncbi:ferric reductase NAD binding domain-containing protein [Limtongia smithiae]|uniref:ferric reductase NAD binding domain-containing protein n=1 Tax=Limtongia smithiae TaxID=1125753 RepID=UPI0034CDE66E